MYHQVIQPNVGWVDLTEKPCAWIESLADPRIAIDITQHGTGRVLNLSNVPVTIGYTTHGNRS